MLKKGLVRRRQDVFVVGHQNKLALRRWFAKENLKNERKTYIRFRCSIYEEESLLKKRAIRGRISLFECLQKALAFEKFGYRTS